METTLLFLTSWSINYDFLLSITLSPSAVVAGFYYVPYIHCDNEPKIAQSLTNVLLIDNVIEEMFDKAIDKSNELYKNEFSSRRFITATSTRR